jgi:ribosomal protein S24E
MILRAIPFTAANEKEKGCALNELTMGGTKQNGILNRSEVVLQIRRQKTNLKGRQNILRVIICYSSLKTETTRVQKVK